MKNNIKIDKNLKKILICGANGFLGKNILQLSDNVNIIEKNFSFIAADINNNNIPEEIQFYNFDITKAKDTYKKIIEISPDVIIHTAAMTDVDQCEIKKKLTTITNIEGTKNILRACKKINSKLVFMSTDFIFDGTKSDGYYKENDIPNPLSHYGKTKFEAELIILNSDIEYLICRSSVLYGWNKDKINYVTWVLDKLQRGEEISIITTQINNATYIRNLAEIILKLVEKDTKGIFNTAGDGPLSRYEMAIKCAEIFKLNKDLIIPVNQLKQKAIRPLNAGLDLTKLKNLLGNELKIFSLSEGLKHMKDNKKVYS